MKNLRRHSPYSQSCENDYEELRIADEADRQRRNLLLAHPNCNDPAHPGCHECREDHE